MPLDHQVPIRLHVVGRSRALSKVGAVAPTTSAMLKSADEVMQSNLELCTPSNVRPLTKNWQVKLFLVKIFCSNLLLLARLANMHWMSTSYRHYKQLYETKSFLSWLLNASRKLSGLKWKTPLESCAKDSEENIKTLSNSVPPSPTHILFSHTYLQTHTCNIVGSI